MSKGSKRPNEETTLDDLLAAFYEMREEVKKGNEYNEYRFGSAEKRMNIVEREINRKSIVISGVPPTEQENIIETVTDIGRVLGVAVVESDIDDFRRIGKEKELIKVTFVRNIIKRQLIKAVRTRKKLTTLEIGFDRAVNVYINEELGFGAAEIWKRARKLKKLKVIANCWTSEGRVLYKLGKDDVPRVCNDVIELLRIENSHVQTPAQSTRSTAPNQQTSEKAASSQRQPLPKKIK